ncbi:hypothetical protein EMEDMD4_190016 [Sinorhizobium medicae]|uniref:Uncharacterized protein n=1 Tax=Sinorhizobium medicae TaxID=110321 RepID=A0A508WTN9_9HYPH|nr:hypothetical protein EMEDMD4_190016 [Sinorhizobium medicae]
MAILLKPDAGEPVSDVGHDKHPLTWSNSACSEALSERVEDFTPVALVSPRNINPTSSKLSTTTAFQKACPGSRLAPREVKFPEWE